MTSVVQSSSSVYSTYISTIDHLPCDIVRSLWVVQACNVAAQNDKEKLHALLENHQDTESGSLRAQLAAQCKQLQQNIRRWNDEACAEAQSLHNQVEAHKAMLSKSVQQLQRAISDDAGPRDPNAQETLRAQLVEHYKQSPLVSQVQARQERVLKDRGSGKPSGIRLVLKLRKPSSRAPGRAARDVELSPKKRGRPRKYPLEKTHHKVAKPAYEPEPLPEPPLPEPQEPQEVYCFCKQPSFGNMIACDFEQCPNGEWFHYKCVGLLNRVEALRYTSEKWYCSEGCRASAAEQKPKPKPKKKRSKW